ncbi:putative Zn(II)2Cys6 transcription factor [Aspergillus udagawae]|nr:putative Zn(II)2Cys6 transcription factor [Aspergillus udagawae]
MVEQQSPSKSQLCLQLAVQATATTSTAQMLRSSDSLYAETCAALEQVEINGPIGRARGVPVELEYIQALLLVVYYEALRMPQDRYILTAGRAFRLIQISRLHEIDAEPHRGSVRAGLCSRRGAERRTFWAAYFFDRIFSIRHELPHTLHEQVPFPDTHTAPSPRDQFQDGKPVRMPFLSEVMSTLVTAILPVFAECVVLATLRGRYMNIRSASPSNAVDFCAKLQ